MAVHAQVRDWLKGVVGEDVWEASQPPDQREGVTLRLLDQSSFHEHTFHVFVFKNSYADARDEAQAIMDSIDDRVGFCNGWAILEAHMRYEGVDMIGRYVMGITMRVREEV